MGFNNTDKSKFLQYLPALFQEDADEFDKPFIGRFLLAFEEVLSGSGKALPDTLVPDDPNKDILEMIINSDWGLEELLEAIYIFFDPEKVPREFLPWLASWVAVSLRENWPVEVKRSFIAEIARRYKYRGTKDGLKYLLEINTKQATSYQFVIDIQDEIEAPPGSGIDVPHFFTVRIPLIGNPVNMTLDVADPTDSAELDQLMNNVEAWLTLLWNTDLVARPIIELEKPAHTYYDFGFDTPTFQIGCCSTIGANTLLGTVNVQCNCQP